MVLSLKKERLPCYVALVRHPALRVPPGICYGRSDYALADPERDIPPIRAMLHGLQAPRIHTSPASRCRMVAARLGGPVQLDPRLHELHFGDWERQSWNDVPREALDRWATDPLGFAAPGGESGAALIARVRSYADDLLAGSGDVIVVSHGGPLKLLLPMLRGEPPRLLAAAPALGSVTIVPYRAGG